MISIVTSVLLMIYIEYLNINIHKTAIFLTYRREILNVCTLHAFKKAL